MAAGIQSADELVLTEMVFNGAFSALSPEQAVALLSCFLWREKSDVGIKARALCTALLAAHIHVGCQPGQSLEAYGPHWRHTATAASTACTQSAHNQQNHGLYKL